MSGHEEVIDFIKEFTDYNDADKSYNEEIRKIFREVYSYYFAHILKLAFNRGEVCWAAPFSHIVWKDTNGIFYDIDGIYSGNAYYFIPDFFIENASNMKISKIVIDSFLNNGSNTNTSKKEFIKLIKFYCAIYKEKYDSSIEKYLKDA